MTRLASLFARLGPDPRADGALLHAFLRDRDEAAFAQLVRRHGPAVWGVCRRQLPAADAEDAFQATFLVLLRRRPAGDTLAPWLYRVAVLTCRGLRRKNARRRTAPLPDVPARPDPPAVDVDALLLKLPERERAAVVLCHLHGLTQREAADRLGVPEGTLSARLSRGLRRLRGAVPVVAAVPVGLAEGAMTAAAGRAARPQVGSLVTEVIRMYWMKKLVVASLAAAAVGGAIIGVTAGGSRQVAAQSPQPQIPPRSANVESTVNNPREPELGPAVDAADSLASPYWLVNGMTLDGSGIGRITHDGGKDYTVTFRNGATSKATLQQDGTLVVDEFQRAVPAGNGDTTLKNCVGARLGKHIFWDTGEHWQR